MKKKKKKKKEDWLQPLPPSLLFLCSAVFQTSNSVTKSHQRQHKFVSKVSRSTSNHTKSYKTLSLSLISRFIGHKYLLIGCKKPNKRIQSIQFFLLKGNR